MELRSLVLYSTLLLPLLTAVVGQYGPYYPPPRTFDDDLRGDYCRTRRPQTCCSDRNDACSVPILGTYCYCDMFCNRTNNADCCPDFRAVCLGIVPPPGQIIRPQCLYSGKFYNPGHVIHINCNKCTCRELKDQKFEFDCEQNVCLVRTDLIEAINNDRHLWRSGNYSFFWGKTLQEGIRHRLGTFKPTRPTMEMREIQQSINGPLPENFDSREKWRNRITPVRDQGDCAASWAFSTTALSSDRLAIESLGRERPELSPQHLLSCQRRGQRACHGGHLDKAWFFIRKRGVTTGTCFPFTGKEDIKCPFTDRITRKVRCPTGGEERLYFMTPPYRVGPREEDIKREIYFNGPVQATFKVHPDFFLYKAGVYHHDESLMSQLPEAFRQHDYHSVRILGWGTEVINGKNIKFWTAANSWGEDWGEDGTFRILRGQNECEVEMFIVGVWAHTEMNSF